MFFPAKNSDFKKMKQLNVTRGVDPRAFWVESRTNQAKMSLAGDEEEEKLRSTHYRYSLVMMPSLH